MLNRTCFRGLGLEDLQRSLPAPCGSGFREEGEAQESFSHHISACSVPLPDVLGKAASTHLDQNLYRFRSTNLEQMVRAALRLKHEELSLPAVLEQAEDWLCRLRAMAEEVTPPCPNPHMRIATTPVLLISEVSWGHGARCREADGVGLKLRQRAVGQSRRFESVMVF